MRWPRRGILIRLAIYVPVIGFLAWRAQGGCGQTATMSKDDALEQKLAPHRKVITLPDGTQQEIVELTAEEAEAILGHPIPRDLDAVGEGKSGAGEAKAGAGTSEAKAGDAGEKSDASSSSAAKTGDVKAGTGSATK